MTNETGSLSPSQNAPGQRGLLFTLVAAFSGVLVGLFLSRLSTPRQEPVNSSDLTDLPEKINDSGNTLSTFQRKTPLPPSISENYYDRRQNKTPRWKILLEILTVAFTGGAVAAATYYAVISHRMWIEMQKQTGIQRQTSINAERPWIKLMDLQTRGNNPIVPALSFQHPSTWPKDKQQVTFQIDVSYRNVGRSVARVTVAFELFLELWKDGYDDAIRKDGEEFCDSHNAVDRKLSVIAYPGDEPLHWYGGQQISSRLKTPITSLAWSPALGS